MTDIYGGLPSNVINDPTWFQPAATQQAQQSWNMWNPELMGLQMQMANLAANTDLGYARLGEQARQFNKTFGWGQNTDITSQYYNQLANLGYMPVDPLLTKGGMEAAEFSRTSGEYLPTLQREQAQWQNQLNRQQLGLNYLQLLSSLSGPRDWLTYQATQRAAANTQLPSWAQSLQSGTNLPAYTGVDYNALGNNSLASWGNVNAATGANQIGLNQAQSEALLSPTPPSPGQELQTLNVPQAHQIGYYQWANMMPSEREMLRGVVENRGGYWPDYQTQMQAAWPAANVTGRSYWG